MRRDFPNRPPNYIKNPWNVGVSGVLMFLLWCGAGSNRRHKDFQSFALPTELPHRAISNWEFQIEHSNSGQQK